MKLDYFEDDEGFVRKMCPIEGDGPVWTRGHVVLEHEGEAEMLFDLSADPGEWQNLADQASWQPVKKSLRKALQAIRDKPPVKKDLEHQP